MTDCWKATPESRPTFTQLRESLETTMQKDNPYLDLTAVDETCAYYNVPSFNSITEESSGDSYVLSLKEMTHRRLNPLNIWNSKFKVIAKMKTWENRLLSLTSIVQNISRPSSRLYRFSLFFYGEYIQESLAIINVLNSWGQASWLTPTVVDSNGKTI